MVTKELREQSSTSSTESIRSVSRVLALLRALNTKPESSLQDLHAATGLPKPTLHRMLETLCLEGYVRSAGAIGMYCLTAKVMELSVGCSERQRIVDMSIPTLIRTTKALKWPLAISTVEADVMVVRFSTMPYSPLATELNTYGHRLPLERTAVGLAYLAFCSDAERSVALQLLRENGCSMSEPDIAERIARTVQRGYGLRLPSQPGGTATMAVPLAINGDVLACISLTTFGSVMKSAFMAEQLPVLREVCAELIEAISLS